MPPAAIEGPVTVNLMSIPPPKTESSVRVVPVISKPSIWFGSGIEVLFKTIKLFCNCAAVNFVIPKLT